MIPENVQLRRGFTAHLNIEWDGVTPNYVKCQVRRALPDLTTEDYKAILSEWVENPIAYPIGDEDTAAWGFYSVQEARQRAGIDVDESNLLYVNAWAYCSYCALQYIGSKLGISFRPMSFVQYRELALKVSLINQGLFEPGRHETISGHERGEIARSKMFTSQVIPRPIDKTAAQVAGLQMS